MQDDDKLPQYAKSEYTDYKIAVNDEVIYRIITTEEEFSQLVQDGQQTSGQYVTSYRVYKDGTIDLPFLAPIAVAGLTIREAEQRLQEAFREIIPDATVKLALYNKTFTVLGDIGSGTYPIYKEKMTIFQALAMTGDVSMQGDRKHVRIIRPQGDKEPLVLEFDLRTNTIVDSEYYWVYPNDVIYVSRSKGSFFKVANYSAFIGLVTSSLSLLISVLNYTTLF